MDTSSQSTPRIFVSHSHKNNAFCAEVVRALRGAGADVWYDDENLQVGQLGPTIERELRERPVFIVVLSLASLGRRRDTLGIQPPPARSHAHHLAGDG